MNIKVLNDESYGGFTNYATYNVCYWLENDFDNYHDCVSRLKNIGEFDELMATGLCEIIFPKGYTPDDEFLLFVNFEEVANYINSFYYQDYKGIGLF